MNCSYFKRELDSSHAPALLSGDLRAHAARCRACAAQWQKHLSLNRLLRELDTVAPPADFDAQLRARLRAEKHSLSSLSSSFIPLPSFARPAAMCASLMFIAVALYVSLYGGFKGEVSEQTASVREDQIRELGSSGYNSIPQEFNSVATSNEPTASPPEKLPVKTKDEEARITSRKALSTRHTRTPMRTLPQRLTDSRGDPLMASAGSASSEAKVPLTTKQQHMEVTLRDTRGEKEAFLLDAVSFGGQPLVRGVKLAVVSSDGQQGIW